MAFGYLRYPHIHGDLLTFVAGDDVWLAPAAGGRAWRLSADDTRASYPRFSRDGSRIAWTSGRDGNPEVYAAGPSGSDAVRLTYWGDPVTRVTGLDRGGRGAGHHRGHQPSQKYRRAYAVPGEGATPPRLLPFGSVNDLAIEESGTALLTGSVAGEPAFWKRYRGGRAGKLWTASPSGPRSPRCWPAWAASWQPDADRRPAVLPVRPRGHREHLLLRAGRQRRAAAHRPRRHVRARTRPPTGTGSSTTWPGTSGCWTARMPRNRTGSTSRSARRPRVARPG